MDLAKARPMLDELKKGPWPSFVKEIEKSAAKNEQAATLLDLLEDSYEEKRVHWKHGGIVGVRGYGGGVIGRYTDGEQDIYCFRICQQSSVPRRGFRA